MNLQWAQNSDIGLPCPDATIFLDLDPLEAERRAGYGTERYEKKEFQERIRSLFLNIFSSSLPGANAHVIDASSPVEIVESQIFDAINDILRSVTSISTTSNIKRVQRLVY